MIELQITKPGKLGIEFRQTSSPYIVIRLSEEAKSAYDVHPGDLLTEVRKDGDLEWTKADGLGWGAFVDVLKHRPCYLRFVRTEQVSSNVPADSSPLSLPTGPVSAGTSTSPSIPLMIPIHTPVSSALSPLRSMSPLAQTASPKELPRSPFVAPRPPTPESPSRAPNSFTVVYSTEGSLGLEFEEMDFPFKVGGVRAGSLSLEKGVWKGDCLVSVNGKSTEGMTWEILRSELAIRPAIAVFKRSQNSVSPQDTSSNSSVWDFAAGLVRGTGEAEELAREVEQLKQIIASLGAEDVEDLRACAKEAESLKLRLGEADKARLACEAEKEAILATTAAEHVKAAKLLEVIAEIEQGQTELVVRFQGELAMKDVRIRELEEREQGVLEPSSCETSDALLELASVEKDNQRLRKENADLSSMVQQCLEKIQKDLADKPHWVDRRVVCSAVATLLREMDSIDEGSPGSAESHASARQRVGDVLGLTFEERAGMGLLSLPAKYVPSEQTNDGIGSAFVNFLEREATSA